MRRGWSIELRTSNDAEIAGQRSSVWRSAEVGRLRKLHFAHSARTPDKQVLKCCPWGDWLTATVANLHEFGVNQSSCRPPRYAIRDVTHLRRSSPD